MKIFKNCKTARKFIDILNDLPVEDQERFSNMIKETYNAIVVGDDNARESFYLDEDDLNSAINIFQNAKKLSYEPIDADIELNGIPPMDPKY